MKKINLVVLVIFCIPFYSHSQSKVGVQLAYGTATEFGIGAKANSRCESSVLEISEQICTFLEAK